MEALPKEGQNRSPGQEGGERRRARGPEALQREGEESGGPKGRTETGHSLYFSRLSPSFSKIC